MKSLYTLFCCFCFSLCYAQGKIGPSLQEAMLNSPGPHTVLVQLYEEGLEEVPSHYTKEEKGQAVYKHLVKAEESRGLALKDYLTQVNKSYRSFIITPTLVVKLNNEEINIVEAMSEVSQLSINEAYMLSDYLDYGQTVDYRDPTEPEWGIQQIEADSVWSLGYRGQGIVVAGQDTGYDWQHRALKAKYRGYDQSTGGINHRYNWHDAIHEINPLHGDSIVLASNNPCGLDTTEPCDDHNHGTHTLGTMVGSDTLHQIGVAPDAKWIACRSMERGYGSVETYLECFEWFLAPTDLNGDNPQPWVAPDVINNSWACPEMEGCNQSNFSILETAISNLKNAGIMVVASAGNSGSDCSTISTPAAIYESSFTVGASNQVDTLAGFSSRGPVSVDSSLRIKPNVVAPGTQVYSSIRDNKYASYGGTSMSGPHVAGAVALILSANPILRGQVDKIEDILEASADPIIWEGECEADQVPNYLYGYGRINVLKAVEAAIASNVEDSNIVNNSISVFPNPATNTISFVGSITSVKIYDALGILQPVNLSDGVCAITHLAAGHYTCIVKLSDGSLASSSFIKVK